MTVPGLIPHVFAVIATHIVRGGDSDGVISSIKRSFKQQRLANGDDRVLVAVRKRDLALRVAVKQMGSLWAAAPAAKTEEGDDMSLHVVYVAKLADVLTASSHQA
ncbi:hypothetical protein BCR44DRAFT_1442633 [Catenaria anguillulae PL171]|uniref:Uncharacterized protein n=1 Tax=Catenaria anguillulae PL171 TaxID=765915 RepID=A0A1Y2H9P4_9FUNG|nr:hypothetical protein BCR44DRAFT_1442633 [Catenaria anguillulae PL171]